MANNVRISTSVDDKVSGPLDRIRDKFDQMGKGAASASLVGNAGAMALAKGVGLAGQAVGFVTDKVGEAIDAYRIEQKSIAGLTAAIDSNVQRRTISNAQIEKTIAAREKLAFADDEQREALKLLIGVTRDETKALDAQRVAMDLARFRNMDLAAASDLVAKAIGGNIGALSRYGIRIREGADATEVLAEIQRIAGGQAEKYAETDLGKVEAASIKVDNAMEKIGETFSKVGATVLPVVADAFAAVVDTFSELGPRADEAVDFFGNIQQAEVELVGTTNSMAKDMEAGAAAIQELAKRTADSLAYQFETGGDRAKIAMNDSLGSIEGRLVTASDKIKEASLGIIDNAWDPLINAAKIRVTEIGIQDTKQELSSKGLTEEEKAQLNLRLLEQQRHLDVLGAERDAHDRDTELKAKTLHGNLLTAQGEYQASSESLATINQWGQKWANTASLGVYGGIDEVYSAGNQLVASMNGLDANGYPIGRDWSLEVAAGIRSGGRAIDSAINATVGSKLIGYSPPPAGPLKDLDKGARNIADAWLGAFAGRLRGGNIDSPLAGIVARAPDTAQGGLSTAIAASAGGGSQELHIYLDGREIEAAISRQAHYRRGATGRFPG